MKPLSRMSAWAAPTLVAFVAAFFLLWPAQLGGGTTYVTTDGTSMEPRFHTGDLAIVRAEEDYAVGDIAAYHSQIFDTVVMHRIVAVEDGRYTLQGDNNPWLDPDHPTRDQLIGEMVLRVPHGGAWLDRITDPVVLGPLSALVVLAGGSSHIRRRRRRHPMSRPAGARATTTMAGRLTPGAQRVAAASAVAGLAGIALGVVAWTSPTTTSPVAAQDTPRSMTFSYSATVPQSPAYDGTSVKAPETVFRKLVDTLKVRYTYRGTPGTIRPVAELSTTSGWHSTLPLGPTVKVDGSPSTHTVSLHLDALDRRANAAAAAIGIPASEVEVAVQPQVTSPGRPTFSPALHLLLGPLTVKPADEGGNLTVSEGNPTTAQPTQTGTLTIAGQQFAVATARAVSVVLTALALITLLLVGLLPRLRSPGTETAAIRRRYGRTLVEVEPMPTPAGRQIIDVVDFPTLARLADRYELMVLHWSRSDVETFVVQDQRITYRYRTGTGTTPTGPAVAEASAPTAP